MTMPNWMSVKDSTVTVDPDGFYPEFLSTLGVSPDTADQLDMETAYRFMQWTVRLHLAVEKLDPRVGAKAKPLTILVAGVKDYKERWAHKHYPEGKAAGMKWRDQLRLAVEEWKRRTNLAVPG